MTDTKATPTLTRTVEGNLVPAAGAFHTDPSHTTVDFVARHLMIAKVRGTFPGVTGVLVVGENPENSTLDVTVEMATVNTRDEGRDTHLRSADFFDVENYPTMTYTSTSVKPSGDRWTTEGQLTIHGVTRTVPLTIEFLGSIADPWGGSRIAFSAQGEIDREDFGLTWNAAIETGGVVVSKVIKIEIEAELVLQA
jgi:polyisoprenoid-binding protein YceI